MGNQFLREPQLAARGKGLPGEVEAFGSSAVDSGFWGLRFGVCGFMAYGLRLLRFRV